MYLTAQRVRTTRGHEGVNAFYYVHGFEWLERPSSVPDEDPGELTNDVVVIPPPGNRVRSYLDVVASDGTQVSELRRAFAMATAFAPTSLPVELDAGTCWFRFNAEQPFAGIWQREISFLFESALMAYHP